LVTHPIPFNEELALAIIEASQVHTLITSQLSTITHLWHCEQVYISLR